MAELTAGYRWAWSFSGKGPTADDLQGAISAYIRRHNGRFPSILFIHPDHLAGGIQPPLGLMVEADQHMNRAFLEFAIPEDETVEEGDRAPVFPLAAVCTYPLMGILDLAHLGAAGDPLPLNGLSFLGLFLVGLAMAIAAARLIRSLRNE